jgi:hypothetical protein
MEAVGLALGALGVAGLFKVCTDCWDLVQTSRTLGKDFVIYETQFTALRWRLEYWSQSMVVCNRGRQQIPMLQTPGIQQHIKSQLNVIALLFLDGAKLIKAHELKERYELQANRPMGHSNQQFLQEGLQDFLQRREKTQRHAPFLKTITWALSNKKRFEDLLKNLEKAVDMLERIEERMRPRSDRPLLSGSIQAMALNTTGPSQGQLLQLPHPSNLVPTNSVYGPQQTGYPLSWSTIEPRPQLLVNHPSTGSLYSIHEEVEIEKEETQQEVCAQLGDALDAVDLIVDCKTPIRGKHHKNAINEITTFNFAFKFGFQWPDLRGTPPHRNNNNKQPLTALNSAAEEQLRIFCAGIIISYWFFRQLAYLFIGLFGRHSLSPAVSMMLPDNIILYDALGEVLSLPVRWFSEWTVLKSMLKTKFSGCPGYSKVMSGQFSISCVKNPEESIGGWNWSEAISKRRKFKMTVFMFQLTMKDGYCVKCQSQKLVTALSASTYTCPQCGLFYHSLSHSRRGLRREELEEAQKPFLPNTPRQFVPPGYSPMYEADMWFWNLIQSINNMLMDSQDQSSEESNRRLGTNKKPRRKRETASDLDSDTDMSGMEEPDIDPSDDVEDDKGKDLLNKKQLAIEESDIKALKSVSLQQAATIHDAALYRSIDSLRKHLNSGMQPDKHPGYWGTPLTAAIFGRSEKTFKMLLKARSDTLSQAGPLRGPIQAAARCGTPLTFNAVIRKAMTQRTKSRRDAAAFQNAVDNALLAMMDDEDDNPQSEKHIYLLLYVGSNPFQRLRKGRTAFSEAIYQHRYDLSNCFLAMAWDRDLFSKKVLLALVASTNGETPDLDDTPGWVEECCTELKRGETQIIERYIAKKIKGVLFWEQKTTRAAEYFLRSLIQGDQAEAYDDESDDADDENDEIEYEENDEDEEDENEYEENGEYDEDDDSPYEHQDLDGDVTGDSLYNNEW